MCERGELVGLAKRHDARILPTVIDALERPAITDRIIEAAYTILHLEDDEKDWSAQVRERTSTAVPVVTVLSQRCGHPHQPGAVLGLCSYRGDIEFLSERHDLVRFLGSRHDRALACRHVDCQRGNQGPSRRHGSLVFFSRHCP